METERGTPFSNLLGRCSDVDGLFAELYRQMYRVAYAMVRNDADAMDIVQESWLKILQKTDSLRDERKLIQWAKAIATNTGINLMKQKYRRNATSLEHINAGEWVRSNEDLEELLLIRTMIVEGMDLLPEDLHKVLIYKFFHGMKDRDIAERLGLPVGTVKAKIHRAKERLRDHLSALSPEADRFSDEEGPASP